MRDRRTPWLMSAAQDTFWLTGSSGAALLVVFSFLALVGPGGLDEDLSIGVLYVAWTVLFDGTHLFATYGRLLVSSDEAGSHRSLLWSTCPLYAVGPLLILGGWAAFGDASADALSFALNRFALLWAYYHLCRQHWGIVGLYRRRSREDDVVLRRIEAILMLSGFGFPYLYASLWNSDPVFLAELQVIELAAWHAAATWLLVVSASIATIMLALRLLRRTRSWSIGSGRVALRGVGVFIAVSIGIALWIETAARAGSYSALRALEFLSLAVFVVATVAWLVASYERGMPLCAPKHWMIGSSLLVHNVVLLWPDVPVALKLIALTLAHNLQYHRVVRLYIEGRATEAARATTPLESSVTVRGDARVRESLRIRMSRRLHSLPGYLVAALGFSVVYGSVRVLAVAWDPSTLQTYVVTALLWGVPMQHYALDALIWRPSQSSQLRRALRVERAVVT